MLIFYRQQTKRCPGFPTTTTKLPRSSSLKHPCLLPIVMTLLVIFPCLQVALTYHHILYKFAGKFHLHEIKRPEIGLSILFILNDLVTNDSDLLLLSPASRSAFIHSLLTISCKLQNSLPHFICIHGFQLEACHDWRF